MDGKVLPSLSHLLTRKPVQWCGIVRIKRYFCNVDGRPFCLRSVVLGSSHQCKICSSISDSCNSLDAQLEGCLPQNVPQTTSQNVEYVKTCKLNSFCYGRLALRPAGSASTADDPEITLQTTHLTCQSHACSCSWP